MTEFHSATNEKLVALWLDYLTSSRGRTHGTLKMYRRIAQQYLWWVGERPLDAPSTDAVERWLQRPREGRAGGNTAMPATQGRDAACLRGLYSFLRERGHVVNNPLALVSTPKIRNAMPKPIGDAAWLQLWEGPLSDSDLILLGLGFFGGLRREELTMLRCLNINLGNRRIVEFQRKGGGDDTLPLGTCLDVFQERLPHLRSDRLWGLLSARVESREGSDWLVSWADVGHPYGAKRNGQLDPSHINPWLDRCTRIVRGHHVAPHQLRHGFGTNLMRSGVPLPIISSLMNHANVQTTMRYLRTGGDSLREWMDRGV